MQSASLGLSSSYKVTRTSWEGVVPASTYSDYLPNYCVNLESAFLIHLGSLTAVTTRLLVPMGKSAGG